MKYIRKFNSIQERDATLANVGFNVLAGVVSGNTVTVEMHEGTPVVDYSIPFYVENITQQSETLTIYGYDWTWEDNYPVFPVEISTDGTNWSSLGTTGATPLTRTLQPGDKVYLRATTNVWYDDDFANGCAIFGVSKVGGNIMSLLYGSNFTGNEITFPSGSSGNFGYLFEDMNDEDEYNRNLISASELILPATTLTWACYSTMFNGCTALTTAPALPATTLAASCYESMFSGCSSLTTAPALPAETLYIRCYKQMFNGCTSLTTAPELPATTLANECYQNMFIGCTALTTAPALPATTLANSCYQNMFNGCTALTTAPTLSATTLANSCYYGMFRDCTSLTTAPATLPATTLTENCYRDMFYHCISLTIAPALPATTLATGCYYRMFMVCTNLNNIKCLATDISASSCTSYWVNGVAASGTFVKDPNISTSTWGTGANGIPSGWTVEDAQ